MDNQQFTKLALMFIDGALKALKEQVFSPEERQFVDDQNQKVIESVKSGKCLAEGSQKGGNDA
ncbi:MAG: hypothetical protein ABJO02_03395 [Reichenbachiella sp.]|uniref:hypothetical protein n=1 Tax=Reichenbachiella sp. TaxID=2184521 RepID=UPI00329A41EF